MIKLFNIKKIKLLFIILRYFHLTIRFNFKYLPFPICFKLPFIFECNAKIYKLKGKVTIDSNIIKTGMIRFKSRNVGVYDSRMRFIFENYGKIIFRGGGVFKAGSAVSVGPSGVLILGDNFAIGPLNKIVCLDSVNIGANALFAWEIMVLDSDFHNVYNLENKMIHKNTKPINIGDNCWIGTRAMLYKNTQIPDNTIVAGMTVLNKNYNIPEYSLLAGSPAVVKAKNVSRLLNDNISQQEIELKQKEFTKYTRNLK